MSDIVLTAAVRQNLLSLQSTADLLASTQNRLSTGKKVNSALDNPTNYFTASSLDARASDINNLLDGISNGVQILQAANTGITSLQKLIDSAKSVANQALQTAVGYSPKSSVTSAAINGATATNLLGQGTLNTAVTGSAIPGAAAGTTKLSALTTAITTGDSLTINGKTISFSSTTGNTSGPAGANLDLSTATVADLLAAVDAITTSGTASTLAAGALTLNTGAASDLTIGGNASTLGKLGLVAGTTQRTSTLAGQQLTIQPTGGGTTTNITFGTGAGQISTLNQLNAALAANNLQASIDSTGKIGITTTSDAASSTIGAISGSAATGAQPFTGLVAPAAVADPTVQGTRAQLIAQYNNIINQITTTSADASYNGVNLLGGDTLKLVFNETGKSTLSIAGVNFTPTGLGLSALTQGTDFIDNNATNKVLTALNNAGSTLRTQAAALGSNLSIVQIRQDFSKNLINVLQTGSTNLTIADTNAEAANSQALSTRQSIAVSALSLANQSQQSVLQLLRSG
ncbi:flagellar protein [Bradyrhizobium sp. U87765 SZCCT0131]|uniref:flagellin N-terminal helical domain-containing protein n=1 Tax=unclassified Bradyrhizobium TaxID=2631580 RepID=UPI001BAD15B3|nr:MULTISPECIES: flagellin [unclassified Bradyrhizobium]MBR1219742.1 flagellar protein [Bradyrhizobium sp. U87765 SZCCT0131]MBR1262393.1 flagellar protein [Bradyrhizobium sp. U87765 SZCCT0134]MBR1308424.1 flagellar protein [Bradyrhizobium sp. U87765 SZCCT0110]MBR1318175.1 flagellar protein [Bradyrhizobium sp. U87765 SZCCT0109]MBR1351878.1 flagellar protein [Bradyrhizobium sp. U87765 SZCCT0048]